MNEFCLVTTTTDQEAHARALAAQIVQARLAACVQVEAIESFYEWQGRQEAAREWRLSIKTREPLYAELERFIRAHHHYDTPEVLCQPITGGSAEYLAWLRAQTTPPLQA
jgi:periplasmic divalent cation tolerance protein